MPAMQRFAAHGSKYGQLTLFMVPLPGALVGLLTNLINAITLPVLS